MDDMDDGTHREVFLNVDHDPVFLQIWKQASAR